MDDRLETDMHVSGAGYLQIELYTETYSTVDLTDIPTVEWLMLARSCISGHPYKYDQQDDCRNGVPMYVIDSDGIRVKLSTSDASITLPVALCIDAFMDAAIFTEKHRIYIL